LVVVISVKIEVRNHVPEVLQDCLASCIARRVRGAHVSWVLSDDVTNGHFVLDHLIVALRVSDDTQVLVRPGVAGNLMPFGNHPFDDVRPLGSRVDSTLTDVDACDEEGSLEAVLGELIKDAVGVDVRAVVVSDGDSPRSLTGVDTLASICYVSLLRTSIIAGACTSRGLVGIAGRAEVDETVRSSTMVLGGTTVSLSILVSDIIS
jgi:hypothetical protein